MSVIYSSQHNILHNELINNGWAVDKNSNKNKIIYKCKNTVLNPYDEFILDYISAYEVAVTVPIPSSSVSYRNVFLQRDTTVIQNYLKIHLSNNYK
jgi:hypothetical protein